MLVADDPAIAACAATELAPLELPCSLLQGGFAAWHAAGFAMEPGTDLPDSACIDYLFFVHDRHDGNKQAARQYLAWETGLLAQLDALELQSFQLPSAASSTPR